MVQAFEQLTQMNVQKQQELEQASFREQAVKIKRRAYGRATSLWCSTDRKCNRTTAEILGGRTRQKTKISLQVMR